MVDPDKGLYDHLYRRFFENRDAHQGYEFQHPTEGNVPPPVVTFAQAIRWWTWDRWKRRKDIRALRDQRVQDIVQIKQRQATLKR